jgi:hypothetical protein
MRQTYVIGAQPQTRLCFPFRPARSDIFPDLRGRVLILDPFYQGQMPLAMDLGPSGPKLGPAGWSNREVNFGPLLNRVDSPARLQ